MSLRRRVAIRFLAVLSHELRQLSVDPVGQERALEAGRVALERRGVSLGPVIGDTVESLRSTVIANRTGRHS